MKFIIDPITGEIFFILYLKSIGVFREKCPLGVQSECESCGVGMAVLYKSLRKLDWKTWKWFLSVI